MMSKEKRRVPKLRFPGFTEDWEQRKADYIFKSVTDKGYPELPVLSASQELGMVYRDQNGIDIQHDKKNETSYKRVLPGQFVIHLRSFQGGFAYSEIEGITSPAYTVMSFKNSSEQYGLFWKHVFKSKTFIKRLETITYGIRDGRSISFSDFKSLLLQYPSFSEQKLIGDSIAVIERGITLHQRKLDNLKLKKKALLQKLFPKNGERYPELRFPGFTDAWEQREFSDIFAEVKSGLSRMLSNDDIGLPVVRANNINDGQLNLVDDIKYWYKNDPQGANTNNYLIEQGDILINFINSEAKMGTAAYVTRRPERDTIYTTNILRCKVNDEYNPYFIYSLTFLNSYKNYIASITKPAVNQASFTTVDFKKYSIKIPTVKEQNQIADLIETFNKLITLHQRKLDHLQLQKKALLQQMFV